MKILHVSTSFKPSWETGGTCRVAYEISKGLARKGHEVTVFTTDRGTKRLDVMKNQAQAVDGVRVYYFRNLSNWLAMKKKISLPYHLPEVAAREVQSFDVVHIHEHRTMLACVISHYARKHDIPYVVQAHGSILPAHQRTRPKALYDKALGNRILRGAWKILALTNTERNNYITMGIPASKVVLVPNGIDFDEYTHLPSRGEFKKAHGIDESERIILYLGRLSMTKGIDLLVRAFWRLRNGFGRARLIMVGPDDGYRQHLERMVQSLELSNKVLFVEFVSQKEKTEAMVDADVLVIPKYTGLPLTFLEACACGTPVITTTEGDGIDWLSRVGRVCKYDERELGEAILEVIQDEDLRAKFGKIGRAQVRENFAWAGIVDDVEDLYQEALLHQQRHL